MRFSHDELKRELSALEAKASAVDDDVFDGYVYIVRLHEYYKIGYAKDVNKRIRQMCEIQLPYPFIREFQFRCKSAKKTEYLVHQHLDEYRHRGEWFSLNPYNLDWAKFLIIGYSAIVQEGHRLVFEKIFDERFLTLRDPFWNRLERDAEVRRAEARAQGLIA